MTSKAAPRPARPTRPAKPAAALAVAAVGSLLPQTAFAYIGPGAGLSAIGVALALVATVALAVLGFVWYPVKRLLRGRSAKDAPPPRAVEHTRGDEPSSRSPGS